jgi:hypothetical protein
VLTPKRRRDDTLIKAGVRVPMAAAQRRIRQGPSRSYMSTDLAASYDDTQPVSCSLGTWTDTLRERRRALLC